ncbi:MAG TPA: hypothetical protein VGQ83_04205 [Polyangia bacterium]
MIAQRTTVALLLVLGLIGCGGRTPATGFTGDAAVPRDDAGNPVVVDDAGQPVLDDAGHPIPIDAAPAADAPVVPPADDAAPQPQQDTGATPGVIPCGSTTCDVATQECCIGPGGGTCIARGAQCQGLPASCDGPEDCAGGTPVCCAQLMGGGRGVQCTAANDCNGQRLCRVDGDCGANARCCAGGTVGGVSITWCAPADQCPNTNPTTGVACGNTSCAAPEVCCQTLGGASCTAAGGCQGLALSCDGPEDCASGTPVCCGHLGGGGGGTQCVADGACTGGGFTSGVVCHSNADCPNGGTCTSIPMGNIRICR